MVHRRPHALPFLSIALLHRIIVVVASVGTGPLFSRITKKFGIISPTTNNNSATPATPKREMPAFIFVRVSSKNQDAAEGSSDAVRHDDDELLVRVAPHCATPAFSREDYDDLVNHVMGTGRSTVVSPLPRRLFSFPLPTSDEDSTGRVRKEEDNRDGDDNKITMASVFESSLNFNDGEIILDGAYKVMTLAEVVRLVEPSNNKSSPVTNHILHLYRQHKLDSRVPGRRLLHGTSGSNIDDYTLRPKPQVVFFDCDDCLYFDDWTIAGHLTKKIENHCQEEFGLPEGHAYALYKKHGTALRGLIAEGYLSRDCAASMDGFLDKVHDLPIHELLSPDEELREMILRIDPSVRKFVFTASVSHHAMRCLEALGIADLIEGIIDVKDCQFETKHSVGSFKVAMEKAGVDDPEACVFLDDSATNIAAAREAGWRSVLVGRVRRDCGGTLTTEHAEHEVDRVHQLPEVVPELFLDSFV